MPETQPGAHDTARNESTRTRPRLRAWLAAWLTGLLAAVALVGPAAPAQAIYNGQTPNAIAFSWVVKLEITYGKDKYICSGSLITHYAVLTAAHCLTQGTPTATKVIFHSGLAAREYSVAGSRIFVKPNYNALTGNNDVAVLYLVKGVSFNEQLATLGAIGPEVSSTVYTAGYGCTTNPIESANPFAPGCTASKQLHTMSTTVIFPVLCAGNAGAASKFCTADNAKSVNHGDSGGPVMALSGGVLRIVGVTSAFENPLLTVGVYYNLSVSVPYELAWIRGVADM